MRMKAVINVTFQTSREKINNSRIIFEDFNTPLSIMGRTTRQKINKCVDDLNNTIN